MIRSLRAIVAWGLLMASPLQAEDLTVLTLAEETVVIFAGSVTSGSSQRLDDILTANPAVKRVGMVSGGGLAVEGFNIASVLSKHKITAVVPRGYFCLSACAIGFLGAADYVVLGVLGFHNMYISDEDIADLDRLELLLQGQQFGVRTTLFFVSNGFELELPLIISYFTNPDTFVVFTNTEDLMTFFARTEEESVIDYLDQNDLNEDWLEAHVWGPAEFTAYIQQGDNNDAP